MELLLRGVTWDGGVGLVLLLFEGSSDFLDVHGGVVFGESFLELWSVQGSKVVGVGGEGGREGTLAGTEKEAGNTG